MMIAVAASLAFSRPPTLAHRSLPCCRRTSALRLGLLDWMLDAPYSPPMEQLTRSAGWDCILRVEGAIQMSAGLRFRPPDDLALEGCVEFVSPSKHFASEGGSWQVTEMVDDVPTAIRWRLQRSSGAGLIGTFRVDVAEDARVTLRNGVLWSEGGGATADDFERVGTCDASPMPLMGSN